MATVVHDVTDAKNTGTERDRLIARLQESNKELENFAWKASHELREPTRKIVAFGDRLTAKYGHLLEDEGRLYLDRMRQAALRMQAKIDALLEFARVGRAEPTFGPVDLGEVFASVLSNLELEENKAQIQCDDLPVIEANATQMEQLFQNLLANAIKFCRPGESPRVEVRCAGGLSDRLPAALKPGRSYLKLEFRDHGIGFDPVDSERIFQLLERLHGRSEYDGSGIGLAICKKIVESHQGCIYAESVPDEGATFIVWLPEKQDPGA